MGMNIDTEADGQIEAQEPVLDEGQEQEADDDGVIAVTIDGFEPEPSEADGEEADDEPLPEKAPSWAKKLRETAEDRRKRLREAERELKELRAKVAPAPQEQALPPKPSIMDDDIDGDEELFAERLEGWLAQKAKHEEKQQAAKRQQQEADERWQGRLTTYNEGKKAIRAPDYVDAEESVQSAFDQTQHGIMVYNAKDPVLLEYALGKNPKVLAELAAIKEPMQFTWRLAQIEKDLKVEKRKPAAAPEKRVSGSTGLGVSSDKRLEELREEAARTGNFDKVMAYKRQMRGK